MKETDFQKHIIDAARAQGGYGKKWSSAQQIGVPDLILRLPRFGDLKMEVKLLSGINDKSIKPGFSRKVNATTLQRAELEKYEKAGGCSVIGVVVDWGSRERHLAVLPWATETLRHADMYGAVVAGSMPYGGHIDLEELMARYKETRVV